jgi:4-alpha-glucanotransferase
MNPLNDDKTSSDQHENAAKSLHLLNLIPEALVSKAVDDPEILSAISDLVKKYTATDRKPDSAQWKLPPDESLETDVEDQVVLPFEKPGDADSLGEKLINEAKNSGLLTWLKSLLSGLVNQYPIVFNEGSDIPLKVSGTYKGYIHAYLRKHRQKYFVIILPENAGKLCLEQKTNFDGINWKDTVISLPEVGNGWIDCIGGDTLELSPKISPNVAFSRLPVAILKHKEDVNKRTAGILLHISSLPSRFGIGDMGPEAYAFAEFLNRSYQSLWQVLPLNPTQESQGYSPYNALSSRAGNATLVSPEMLVKDGLLVEGDLQAHFLPDQDKVDFSHAQEIKDKLLQKAFKTFLTTSDELLKKAYDAFCSANIEWLDDYAVFILLKSHYNDQHWYEWPDAYKLREPKALADLEKEYPDTIHFIKWQQFIFDRQWKALKRHCNDLEVKLMGDMPFYVSYDSVDVWANSKYFALDAEGKLTGVAGVPPDAFSTVGQLWGMPVYNWQELKANAYQWWVERLRKNTELFDYIRLDHFRAFADYWDVPGGEETAIRGSWKLGPGMDFFKKVKDSLGDLPFIAEDLGELSPLVGHLRDDLGLKGMKVLQFAFSENMGQSEFIPHNYGENFVAYTGTHDNNTIRGWYTNDADDATRERFAQYVGYPVDENNCYVAAARLIYSSVAKTIVLPVQDILNLDEKAKMNSPGTNDNNWSWRLLPGLITSETETLLRQLAVLFNRD